MGRNCRHRCVGTMAVELVDQRHEVAAKRRRHCVPQAAGGRSHFFMKELEKPRPNLRDSWYPWLIAFGLGGQVDYWSSRNPSSAATADFLTSSDSTTHTSSSGAAAATGWSGGGGLSGGAGATGMWAAAAAGMAAGVAIPDSSSAGGGSSSGGSSGGGGGGGW